VGIVQREGAIRLKVINHADRKTLHRFIKQHTAPDTELTIRSVVGTYHKLTVKHLDAYLDELEWRFNNRKNSYLFRDRLMKLLASKNLEYQELVAS